MPIPEQYLRKPSKEEINDLPIERYPGPVHIIRTQEELEAAVDTLRREAILGFDTESRPAFRKGKYYPPSVVQLASSEAVYIIQLTWLPLNDTLTSLLADPDVLKVGVAIYDDLKELQKLHEFTPAGIRDLGDTAKRLGLETHGLRSLAANLLGVRISKAARCSNWAGKKLQSQQIIYAATDAWIGRELYFKLKELEDQHGVGDYASQTRISQISPPPDYDEDTCPEDLLEEDDLR